MMAKVVPGTVLLVLLASGCAELEAQRQANIANSHASCGPPAETAAYSRCLDKLHFEMGPEE
jgi:hypothetical protein